MHNAVLEDERNGDQLLLWAILSEKMVFPNSLTSEPVDIGKQTVSRAIADAIHHEPMTLNVVADFVGEPGNTGQGGPGYEMEQYNKLVDFSNRDTTFKWTSYIFVQQTSYSQIVQPGLVIGGLGMSKFEAVKGKDTAINIIGGRIDFQSIVFTEGGNPVSSEEVHDRGRQVLKRIAKAALWPLRILTASINGVAKGVISLATGSVPYQTFTVRLGGKDIDFWLRGNDDTGYVTYGVAYNGNMVVDQRLLVYAEDMFDGVTCSALRGLHVIPLDVSDHETEVTTENLGRTVELYVFEE